MTPKMLSVLNLQNTSANPVMNVSKYFQKFICIYSIMHFYQYRKKTHFHEILL